MVGPLVVLFCRMLLALVFTISLIGKLRDRAAFEEAIVEFQLLPPGAAILAARVFLASEALVVVLLALGGAALPAGFGLALLLLAIFSTALLLVLRRKLAVVCNCFGRTEQHISRYDLVRNALLAACGLLGLGALGGAGYPFSSQELVVIGLMAAAGAAIITNLADVVETLRQPIRIR